MAVNARVRPLNRRRLSAFAEVRQRFTQAPHTVPAARLEPSREPPVVAQVHGSLRWVNGQLSDRSRFINALLGTNLNVCICTLVAGLAVIGANGATRAIAVGSKWCPAERALLPGF